MVSPASPQITTQVSSARIGLGHSVTDTATLTGGYNIDGQDVTFSVYGPVDPNAQHTNDVTVAIYLHVPYPNTRSIVGAHQDNVPSPRAEATHARM